MFDSSNLDMTASEVSSMNDMRNCHWQASGSHGVRVLSAGAMYKHAAIGHILHPWGMPICTSNSFEFASPIL